MHRDDDEAWRAIVDNYGDRHRLEDHEPDDRVEDGRAADAGEASGAGGPDGTDGPGAATPWEEPPEPDWDEDRFVPPTPPPVPTTSPDRYVAWAGVFGSPALLLISLVLGIALPELVAYALVIGFVGGFLYLVVKMPRGPRDPGDDGARI